MHAPIASPCDTHREYRTFRKGSEYETKMLTQAEYENLNSRREIATDLQELLGAGIHPKEVDTSTLLTATSVDAIASRATNKAVDILNEYSSRIRHLKDGQIHNSINNQNEKQDEQK